MQWQTTPMHTQGFCSPSVPISSLTITGGIFTFPLRPAFSPDVFEYSLVLPTPVTSSLDFTMVYLNTGLTMMMRVPGILTDTAITSGAALQLAPTTPLPLSFLVQLIAVTSYGLTYNIRVTTSAPCLRTLKADSEHVAIAGTNSAYVTIPYVPLSGQDFGSARDKHARARGGVWVACLSRSQ